MHDFRSALAGLASAALGFALGCGGNDLHPLAPAGREVASITLTSRSFGNNGTMPIDYSCDGKSIAPGLTWSSPPEGTKTLALMLEDSDAASHTQWLVWNLPAETTSLPEGSDIGALGGKLGANDSSDVGYGAPCPPHHELHRFVFHIFAVDKELTIPEGTRRQGFDAALNGHVIGEGTLTGQAAR
jgi:Raf kinase inhibitor-like YbhB/YbcL family protein